MTQVEMQKAVALIARWNFQCAMLARCKDNSNREAIEARIATIAGQAMDSDIALPAPPNVADPVFGEIIWERQFDDASETATSEHKETVPMALPKKSPAPAVAPTAPVAVPAPAAAPAPKAAKAPKVPKADAAPKVAKPAKVLHPCFMTGQPCKGNFAGFGQDAKLKSLIGKIERGEAQIADLPEHAAPVVKFIKNPDKEAAKTRPFICTHAPVRFPEGKHEPTTFTGRQ